MWGWTLCGTDETLLIQKMLFPHSWFVVGFCLIGSCLLVFIGFVVIWFAAATPGGFSHTRAFLDFFFAACLPLSDPKQKFRPLVSLPISQFHLELECNAIAAGINGLSLQID